MLFRDRSDINKIIADMLYYVDKLEELFNPSYYKFEFENLEEKSIVNVKIEMLTYDNKKIMTQLQIFYSNDSLDKPILKILGESLKSYFVDRIFKKATKNLLRNYVYYDKTIYYEFKDNKYTYSIKIREIKPKSKEIIITNFYSFYFSEDNKKMYVEINKDNFEIKMV